MTAYIFKIITLLGGLAPAQARLAVHSALTFRLLGKAEFLQTFRAASARL